MFELVSCVKDGKKLDIPVFRSCGQEFVFLYPTMNHMTGTQEAHLHEQLSSNYRDLPFTFVLLPPGVRLAGDE